MASGALPGAMVDSLQATPDSGLVPSPLPDPMIAVVQWIFQKPGWLMISGIVIGAIVAVVACWLLWTRRKALWTWLVTRSRGAKLLMASTVGAFLLVAGGVGYKAYDYMEHDNDFCRGCHVFIPYGEPFVRPDTGTYLIVNMLEGKHDTLECHDCHLPDMKAQALELVLWMVDRPDMVPEHEKVPPTVCKSCHEQGEAKDTWQEIVTTAGHRVHFESDSLKDEQVECLTCHARSAHRFEPVDSTCSQQGCHLTDDVTIRLGKMTDAVGLHCAVCHEFTAAVPRLATVDSASGTLVPGDKNCFSCHEMQQRLQDFDPTRDPHDGKCGMCHNPHTNVKPDDALKSCATAACHGDWRKVEFHTGAAHRKGIEDCETCHTPHAARVDASACASCHERVRGSATGKAGRKPPLPFDTTKALRSVSALPDPIGLHGKGDAPPDDDPPAALLSAAPADSFEHARHKDLACITCHTTESKTSTLNFVAPRGCQVCHHTAAAKRDCTACHATAEFGRATVSLSVTVPKHAPRPREVAFEHAQHEASTCVQCHATPVSLAPPGCADCHEQHHTEATNCAACHAAGDLQVPHTPPVVAHERCDACHTPASITPLTPSRPFCLTCHQPQDAADHWPDRECTTCHLDATPAEWRNRLVGGRGA